MPHNVKAQLIWTQMTGGRGQSTEVTEQKTHNRNQKNEFGIGNLHHKVRIHINGHLDWSSSENVRIFRHKLINKLMQRRGS